MQKLSARLTLVWREKDEFENCNCHKHIKFTPTNKETRVLDKYCIRVITAILLAASRGAEAKVAFTEISRVEFSMPCLCSLNKVNATNINWDHVVFPCDIPMLPLRYIVWQLPMEIFTTSNIPLKIMDFSHGSMQRLTVRLFDGTEEEINFSHNKLGDNLNPVFSMDEFRNLKSLHVLDLNYSGLSCICSLTGCEELK